MTYFIRGKGLLKRSWCWWSSQKKSTDIVVSLCVLDTAFKLAEGPGWRDWTTWLICLIVLLTSFSESF